MPGNDLLDKDIPLNVALVPPHIKFKIKNLDIIEGYLNKDQTLILLYFNLFLLFSSVSLFS